MPNYRCPDTHYSNIQKGNRLIGVPQCTSKLYGHHRNDNITGLVGGKAGGGSTIKDSRQGQEPSGSDRADGKLTNKPRLAADCSRQGRPQTAADKANGGSDAGGVPVQYLLDGVRQHALELGQKKL